MYLCTTGKPSHESNNIQLEMYLCTTGKPSNESNKSTVGNVLVYYRETL